jgi:two-component system, OmpR family, sensor histidine kinase KdpD
MRAAARIGIAASASVVVCLLCKGGNRMLRGCSCRDLRQLIDELPKCGGIYEMLTAIDRAFRATFGFPLAILMSQGDRVWVQYHSTGFVPDQDDMAAAASTIASGEPVERAGRHGSDRFYFLPLSTSNGPIGSLAFRADRNPGGNWPLIRSFANQTSLAVLRSSLEDQARYAKVLSEADQFQKTLLDSIAHNVRTPLASIIGSLSTLQEDHPMLNEAIRRELVDTARHEADRLNRLLGNLLDLSRLESRAVRVRADPCDVQDVIGAALEQLGTAARNRSVQVTLDPSLPPVHMDFVLIVQVIVNILDNAFKYSPEDRPVLMHAGVSGNALAITICDEGQGIPQHDLDHVFQKFNRVARTSERGGIGLGLSICRGLIEAHKGTITIERREPHGTAITFTLPLHRAANDGSAA